MITYNGFQFAAAPGTSHHWVQQALKCAQYEVVSGNAFQVHQLFPEEYTMARLTCVRHPEAWLKVIYNEGRGLSISGVSMVASLSDMAKDCGSFLEFVDDILIRSPGVVGRCFSAYRATSVIREEDLPYSLLGFLTLIDEVPEGPFHRIVSLPVPGRNANKMRVLARQPEELPLKLYRRLMDSEGDFCDIYEYH